MQGACAILYCHLCPLGPHQIFRYYLINGTISKKVIKHKMCVRFSLQLLFQTFLILRRIQQDIAINVNTSSYKVPVILVRFWCNLNVRDRFSKKKKSSTKFHQNSYSACRVVPCGRLDGRTDRCNASNSRFLQFCERAWKQNGLSV